MGPDDPGPTPNTKVLISFGSAEGGFEFAMALRQEVYAHFHWEQESEPGYCYVDAESLRRDGKTTYDRNETLDTNFMRNKDWKHHYGSAMKDCSTMIILLTAQWLRSEYCWGELEMLEEIAASRGGGMKVVVVVWPDARALLSGGSFPDRKNQVRSEGEFMGTRGKIPGGWTTIEVSGASGPGRALIERTGGANNYIYACTAAETQRIIHEVTFGA